MGRRAIPSHTLTAMLRQQLGLTQAELGDFLGLTRGQVAHVEAGRHLFAPATEAPLWHLLHALPDPNTPATDPAAHLAPPDAAPLAARLDYCQHHAARLRRELAALTRQLEVARRWQAALPALLAQAEKRARPWLLRRQAQATADLDGEAAARYHLLRLRAAALETEALALGKLLAATEK